MTKPHEAKHCCVSINNTSEPAFQEITQVSFGKMHRLNDPCAGRKSPGVHNIIDKRKSLTHVFSAKKKDLNRTYILPKFLLFSHHLASDASLPNAEKKSWRHLIQSKASGSDVLPTRVSENEDRVSEEDEIEDPDQIKRTRSGKVFFTQTTPIKSILKVSPSNHQDQETFKYQSPSDLEAYKIDL